MTPKDRGATGDAKLSENYRRVPGENQGEALVMFKEHFEEMVRETWRGMGQEEKATWCKAARSKT